MTAIAIRSATVIPIKDIEEPGFEVLLLKRHQNSSFMGGFYVYPGGKVDKDDGMPDICSVSRGITAEQASRMFDGLLSPEESIAHWFAGIRELFEESGVLLAYDRAGNVFHPKDDAEREKFGNYRTMLQKKKLSLQRLAEREGLVLAADMLHYYAHWITPEAMPERFDTRFFLVRYPEGQQAAHDERETTNAVWLTPEKALEKNLKGDAFLSPPTLKTLEDLSRYKTIDDVFLSLDNVDSKPILPVLTKVDHVTALIFPWDSDYDRWTRGEKPASCSRGRPSRRDDNTSRLLLEKGRWLPYCYDP